MLYHLHFTVKMAGIGVFCFFYLPKAEIRVHFARGGVIERYADINSVCAVFLFEIIKKLPDGSLAVTFALKLTADHKPAHRPAGIGVVVVVQNKPDHGIAIVYPERVQPVLIGGFNEGACIVCDKVFLTFLDLQFHAFPVV